MKEWLAHDRYIGSEPGSEGYTASHCLQSSPESTVVKDLGGSPVRRSISLSLSCGLSVLFPHLICLDS